MTIDEAIAKYKEITNTDANCPIHCMRHCDKCVQESRQLATWLEELKDYRGKNKMVVRIDVENMDSIKDKIEELSRYAESQYRKAIDDFAILMKETLNHDWATTKISEQIIFNRLFDKCNEIAEQLKAGVENEI